MRVVLRVRRGWFVSLVVWSILFLMSSTAVEEAEATEVEAEVEGTEITMTGKKVEGEVVEGEAGAAAEVETTMMTSTVEEEIMAETGSPGAVLGMTTITVAHVATEAHRTVTMIGTTIVVEDTDLEPTREDTLSQLSVNLRLLLPL